MLPLLAKTPQELSAANVTHSTMENIGFLLAALVTGVVLVVASPAVVFAAAAAVALLNVVLISDDHPRPAARLRAARRRADRDRQRNDARLPHPARAIRRLRLSRGGDPDAGLLRGPGRRPDRDPRARAAASSQGSVGFLNAAWGVGALIAAAGLALLLQRGRLVAALVGGSLVIGAAAALPGAWTVPFAAYLGWLGIGFGYTFIEVASKTLLQRLGSDETLGRVIGSLESGAAGGDGARLDQRLGRRRPVRDRGSAVRARGADAGLRPPLLDESARARGGRPGRRGVLRPAARQLDLLAAAGRDPRAPQPRPGPGHRRRRRGGDHPGRAGRQLLPDRGGRGRGLRKRRLPPQRGARGVVRRDRPSARRAPHRDRPGDRADPAARGSGAISSSAPSPATAAAGTSPTASSTRAGRPATD